MSKRKAVRAPRKAVARIRKKRPIRNWFASAWRFVKRVPWWCWALCSAAFVALCVVEVSVVEIVRRMANDPVTEVILVSTQILASLGLVIGPFAVRSLPHQAKSQRKLAWGVFWACLGFCLWSLSTTLANANAQMTADAARSAPTFATDQARLLRLNNMIDAIGDEHDRNADLTLQNFLAERDLVQARLDAATPRPVLFGGLLYWVKAVIFHGLVAGFSSAFAVAMAKRRSTRSKRSRRAPEGWPYLAGEEAPSF